MSRNQVILRIDEIPNKRLCLDFSFLLSEASQTCFRKSIFFNLRMLRAEISTLWHKNSRNSSLKDDSSSDSFVSLNILVLS